jgi:hypothetical protein
MLYAIGLVIVALAVAATGTAVRPETVRMVWLIIAGLVGVLGAYGAYTGGRTLAVGGALVVGAGGRTGHPSQKSGSIGDTW